MYSKYAQRKHMLFTVVCSAKKWMIRDSLVVSLFHGSLSEDRRVRGHPFFFQNRHVFMFYIFTVQSINQSNFIRQHRDTIYIQYIVFTQIDKKIGISNYLQYIMYECIMYWHLLQANTPCYISNLNPVWITNILSKSDSIEFHSSILFGLIFVKFRSHWAQRESNYQP
jgi:hypothetical protein